MKILAKLREEGMPISMDRLKMYGGVDVIGRLHIAKAMLGEGHVKAMKVAFKEYLNVGGRCFVPRKTFTSREAIELIKGYGGLVVMAHPFLIPGQKMELTRIINGLAGLGIDGIEVYYIENTPEETRFLENICEKHNLIPTGGTDYHGVNKPGVSLGVGRGDMSIPYSLMYRMLQRI
jgi:predicted metal-dependent phosphoesterase TrpH